MAQNELAKELYGAGLFAPQNADSAVLVLEMMSFEGKDKLLEKIKQNGTMFQVIQQLMMQVQQLSAALGAVTGMPVGGAPAAGGPQPAAPQGEIKPNSEPEQHALGKEQQSGKRIQKPRERALNANSVEGE